MDWPRLLAYITGTVDQELLLRNEYSTSSTTIGNATRIVKKLERAEKTWTSTPVAGGVEFRFHKGEPA